MQMPEFTPAIATIAAALTAGGVAYLASILSKEQKTSEFRQAWIDSLREDVSKYIGIADTLFAVMRAMAVEGKSTQEFLGYLIKSDSALIELTGLYYRVRLRLNRNEHLELLSALDALHKLFTANHVDVASNTDLLISKIDEACHRVLKHEWERVKRGEKAFYLSKYISLAILLGAGGFLICLILGHIALFWVP